MQQPKPALPQFYRYAGLVVRVHGDTPVAVTVRPHPRSRFFNPLPRRYRRMIREQGRRAEQADKLDRLNVSWKDAWTDVAVPTGATP